MHDMENPADGNGGASELDHAGSLIGSGNIVSADHKQVCWRDLLPVHPAAELLPRLSHDELLALGEDIKNNGMRIPIVVGHRDKYDQQFKLWDGRNRLDALDALGLLTADVNPDDKAPDGESGLGNAHWRPCRRGPAE
jgi:hypothetical protein